MNGYTSNYDNTRFFDTTHYWMAPPLIWNSVNTIPIMPIVTDVRIIVPNKVVEVTFSDGTKEKAVCHKDDTFTLEAAIAICISKKIMGGSSAYNNAVKRGIKVYEDKLKREEFNKAEQERIEKRRAKRLAYKKRREEKKVQVEKERQIEIQKEAYIRAMEYMNNSEYVQAR